MAEQLLQAVGVIVPFIEGKRDTLQRIHAALKSFHFQACEKFNNIIVKLPGAVIRAVYVNRDDIVCAVDLSRSLRGQVAIA